MHKFFQKISLIYWKLYYWIKIKSYSRLSKKNDNIFDINLDGFHYKLTFLNQKIGPAIVQRIEGKREPETTAVYRSLVRPGMNVLELGACYGEFTVLLDHLVGPTGNLVSVEGTPNIFKILQKNFEINKLKNTKIFNLFISNSDNKVIFSKDDMHPYNAIKRLNDRKKLKMKEAEVQKNMRISEFLNNIVFKPDIIVMDIEGFEVDVIQDLFIKNKINYHPLILFEIHEHTYKNGLEDLINILKNNNYNFRRIKENLLCF